VLLQPTSPLREAFDIDHVLEFLLRKKAEKVVTVCATEQLLFTKDNGDILKLVSDKKFLKSTNRQQLPGTYKLDGSMIYAVKTVAFLRDRSFLKGKVLGYEIPVWRGVDLDEPEDFVVGEILFKHKKNILQKIKNFK
jgi:CMP-N-acetylneuraminic acid synthetase